MIEAMRPFVKYTDMVKKPDELRYILEKAVYIAREGRPGPSHIDLPIDMQMSTVGEMVGFTPNPEKREVSLTPVFRAILEARRPILIAGAGIRLAGAEDKFRKLVKKLGWPVCPSWAFADCLPDSDPNRMGLFGVYGNRGANFAVQNADLLLTIGTRMDSRMTGKKEGFAREAKIIMVDIDRAETKNFDPDMPINIDAKDFIERMTAWLNSSLV